MESVEKVSIRDIVKDLDLKIVHMPKNKDYYVYSQDINRPGLQFAGYFEDFAYERIQIVGKTEYNYFGYIDDATRRDVLVAPTPYKLLTSIIPRPLISIKCLNTSGACPTKRLSSNFLISTASSATSL